ncbi:hypothetical protein AAF712_010010 [Marasmius tenuissimus]|uniref:NADH dehydrogenase [ubiquinone] 1 alpha subcomplex subunit n=1 Tax=Marasmius tenuissimus TaxID=585030 RepID=A0ABR2ZRW7_9AGAR
MVSLHRTVRNLRRVGLREWWRQLNYIGDAKSGRLVGTDHLIEFSANFAGLEIATLRTWTEQRKFQVDDVAWTSVEMVAYYTFEGRHRWVDFAQHDYHASQVPPEWHAWISHIRASPPAEDEAMKRMAQPWQAPWRETLTGTRGAYKSYNTAAPKINAWQPKTIARA